MKLCKKCGLKIPDEALFCIYCGSPYEPSTAVALETTDEQPEQALPPLQKGDNSPQSQLPSQNDINGNNDHVRPAKEVHPKPSGPVKPVIAENKYICPICGQEQADDRAKCFRCGAEFINTDYGSSQDEKPKQPSTPPNSSAEDFKAWKEEVIRKYLDRVKNEVEAHKQQEKSDVLVKIGLTCRAYPKFNERTEEYPLFDQNSRRWYKAVAIQVTDQEWETIEKAYQTEQSLGEASPKESNAATSNGIANSLKIIGYIAYAAAFILGIVLGMAGGTLRQSFSFGIALACWFAGFVVGTMLLGFGEIIRLLDKISKQNKN